MTDPSSIASSSSTPPLPTPLPPKGILKNSTAPVTPPTTSPSPFEGERISMASAEEKISSLKKEKKRVCFFPVVTTGTKETKFLYDDPTYGNGKAKMTQTRTPLTLSETSSSQELTDLSLKILNWAKAQAAKATSELKGAKAMLALIEANPMPNEQKLKSQLEAWISVARERSLQAKRYAVWAQLRTELIKENKSTQEFIRKKGVSISSAWTIEQMNDDFAMTQAEPWAQPPDPSFDEIRSKISVFIVSKKASETASEAIATASSKITSLPRPRSTLQEERKTESTSTASAPSYYVHKESTLGPKGIYEWADGSYDFSKPYALQEVETFEDGTVVKVDPYDGQRYWFPPPSHQDNDVCTVS